MKKGFKDYLGWGLTVLAVGALSMLLFFCIYKFSAVMAGIRKLIDILMPVIIGVAIAYVLSPVYNWGRRRLRRFFYRVLHWHGRKMVRFADVLAMVLTFCGAIALIAGLIALIMPQLVNSITNIAASLPNNLMAMSQRLQRLLQSNPVVEANAMAMYAQAVSYVEQWIQNSLAPSMQDALSYVSIGVMSTVTFVKNIFIGIVVAVYLMSGKERFLRGLTRMLYALLGARRGNLVMENARYAHQVFSGFIGGKLVDSLIIFCICAVVLPIMNMPYAMLISVVIGVTNIIPFFGPFIGAVPALVLVLMVSPIKTLYLLIYILVLQQFDGNILGPKILGDSTGLSSFWVLFAILLFGGLFGFVGMLIGVPVFAVLYHIVNDLISQSLRQKNLPLQEVSYSGLDHIDEESGEVIHRQCAAPAGQAAQRQNTQAQPKREQPQPKEEQLKEQPEEPQQENTQQEEDEANAT